MPDIVARRSLRSLLEHRAESTPDATFVIFDDLEGGVSAVSFAEFDARVNRTAHLLADLGIGRGEKINLHLGNCPEFLYLWLGAAKLGAVIMPTNVAAAPDELAYLVDHSESRLVFTVPAHLDVAREVAGRCPGVREVVICGAGEGGGAHRFDDLLAGQPDAPPGGACESDDEAAILYTSGTTSRPKGVLVTHANYLFAGETVAKATASTSEDRHLVVMPLFHGNAQYYSTMSALVTGASMVLCARFSASRYFDTAIRHGCTVSSLFAAPIRMLLAQPRREELKRNRLRVVLFAQNVTPEQLDDWHERFGAPLLQLWGMTETMGPPLMNPLHYRRDNMSMGIPTMGYEVGLVDESGRPVRAGEVGQVVVRGVPGRTLMKGYFKNEEATRATIRQGWLWSGDNARQDGDGYFHFVDRAKDMIKRSGENVAASEVEAVILEHPAVFDCAVVGVPDPMRDEAIVAVVVRKDGESADADTLIGWCRERLARFRVPERIEFRDTLPRTSVGKIQKHLLRRELAALEREA